MFCHSGSGIALTTRHTPTVVSLFVSCPYAESTFAAWRRLGMESSYRGIVAYGVHAGFPLCCIYFYARVWIRWGGPVPELYEECNHDPDEETRRRLWDAHPEFMRSLEEKFKYLDEVNGREVDYVRCPACVVTGNRAQTREVDTSACGCWLTG